MKIELKLIFTYLQFYSFVYKKYNINRFLIIYNSTVGR